MELYNALYLDGGGNVTLRTSGGGGGGTTVTVDNLPASLGIKTSALSLSVTPASDANMSREMYSTVTILVVQTAAIGTNYTAFASQTCSSLDIANYSGTDIQYLRNGAGNSFLIPTGVTRLIQGITNANQISIRRVDTSNTQVSINAESFQV